MTCATCGKTNPAVARFCIGCGQPRAPRCPACGTENQDDARFCMGCGAPLGARSSAPAAEKASARKVVTIVFADLIGSVSLQERLDAESGRRVMERYHRAMSAAVEVHGGTVVQLLGDGVLAAFGVPRVAEDDALRAVRAGVGMQRAFRELVREIGAPMQGVGLRVAVHTGEVVVSDDETSLIGDPTNVAARLQHEARDGDVLVGEATQRIIGELVTLAPAGTFALRGRSETVTAYRVVSLDRPAGARTTAFVGRDEELRRIMAVYESAVAERRVRLAVILGSPGLGKSRLLDEIGCRLGPSADTSAGGLRSAGGFGPQAGGRAMVLNARCDSTGGATFAPMAEALRGVLLPAAQASPAPTQGVALGSRLGALSGLRAGHSVEDQQPQRGDQPAARGDAPGGSGRAGALHAAIAAVLADDTDRARIAGGIAALLAGTPAEPEETFFVVRRFLAALAMARPVVLAIDDLQWAEPLLLDLIEHLVQWGSDIPLCILAGARPELRDMRSSLTAPGGFVSEVVTLSGLDAGAATRMAANVIGAELPAAVAGRVLATSEGNPLFLGELVRVLVNDGVLQREGERWTVTVDLATLDMPPTIHALLAARIERLRAEDRAVLERAAVIGRQFSRSALTQLLPRESSDLDARLEALRRSELIEPDTTWFLGEPALRFHHGLTRDAAYRRLLKETRAELHGRLADWITTKVGEAIEHDEMIGWHLERAYQHLRELGPLDAPGRALGERAARYLSAAGRRALARDDVFPAADLLGRALHVLDAADPTRADLAVDWCEALLAAGDVAHAQAAIGELGRWVDDQTPFETPVLSPVEGPPESFETLRSSGGGSSGRAEGLFSVNNSTARAEEAPSSQGPSRSPHRLRAWHTCFAGQLAVLTGPQALRSTVDALAAAATELAALGDRAGEAKAHQVHALALQRLGAIGAAEAALDKALAAARRVEDRRRSNAVLAGAPQAALWGPSPVTRASGRCLDVVRVLRITQGALAVEAVALRCQAVLEALRGRADAAQRMIASSRKMVAELGITQQVLETDLYIGLIAIIEDNAAAAEPSLRAAYEGFRTHGLGIDAARAAALLGRALFVLRNAAEAEALSHESEALAGDDLQAAIAWRRVRAETLAARGEHAEAVAVARAAVELAGATDALLLHANARMALAAALHAAGRHDAAASEEARAIELWEAKGATLLVQRARAAKEAETPFDRLRVSGRVSLKGGGESARAEPVEARGGVQPAPRRVRPNAATAFATRLEAAIAAGDAQTIPLLFAEEVRVVDHPTGLDYGRQEVLDSIRMLPSSRGQTLKYEPLATLGDSFALCRFSVSAVSGGVVDAGAWIIEALHLVEVETHGRSKRSEIFALNRLGDAVARLYERYAEILPDGPERERAAAVARSVATMMQAPDLPDHHAGALSPTVELVDHRTLGTWSARGPGAMLRQLRSLRELSSHVAVRVDEILALAPSGYLVRWTTSGTDRASGGEYEREFLMLCVFGADGLLTHCENFDSGRADQALARFDELTHPSGSPLAKGRMEEGSPAAIRRVRANAATANMVRLDAVMATRDGDALPALLADEMDVVEHYTGAVYDREGALASLRALLGARNPAYRHEPLATLGERLVLCRLSWSASGFARGKLDVGASETEMIEVIEVDASGRRRRSEVFAADKLGDAVVRLYERYVELLPDGPERERIAAIARSSAAHLGPLDLDRMTSPLAPGVKYLDHCTAGFGSVHGIEGFRAALHTLFEGADDVANRVDDVPDLRPEALVLRITNFGTLRAGGGTYERPFVMLWIFGADGLMTHIEQFDVGHEAEALARFDELTRAAEPVRSVHRRMRPNAATALIDRGEPLMAARDLDAVAALWADDIRYLHGRAGVVLGREEMRAWMRLHFEDQGATLHAENIATLGDSLALQRATWSGSTGADPDYPVGAFERCYFQLCQVDAQGRMREGESFAPDRLADAIARLYERHAALVPDSPERVQSVANARFVVLFARGPDETLDPVGPSAMAPDIEVVDHRTLGTWSVRGREALVQNFRAWRDVADDITIRAQDILALRAGALLVRWAHTGTDRRSGGGYERPFLLLWIVGADGLMTRWEFFEPDREADALVRFDELVGGEALHPAEVFANAASRSEERMMERWAARDWVGVMAFYSPALRFDDRRRLVRLEIGGEDFVAQYRMLFDQPGSRWHEPLLATRGERLSLHRVLFQAEAAEGGGPLEFEEHLALIEVDTEGRQVGIVAFDLDDLDGAYAELDARWDAGEATAHPRASAWIAAFRRAFASRDWEAMAALHAPDQVAHNHRLVGWGTLRGPRAWIAPLEQLVALAPDVRLRVDHLRTCERGFLFHYSWQGTREGGEFDTPQLLVVELDGAGRQQRLDVWDCEALDAALTRFAELIERNPSVSGVEFFELEEPDAARARFEELRPPSPPERLRLPRRDHSGGDARARPLTAPLLATEGEPFANAATRASDRQWLLAQAGDWEALEALCASTLVFEDRRRGLRRAGDREMFVASLRISAAPEVALKRELVATAGDRLSLERRLRSRTEGGVTLFEVEGLTLTEINAEGRIAAVIVFDPDERAAAERELSEGSRRADAPSG